MLPRRAQQMNIFDRGRRPRGAPRDAKKNLRGIMAPERLVPLWGRDGAERALMLRVAKEHGAPLEGLVDAGSA